MYSKEMPFYGGQKVDISIFRKPFSLLPGFGFGFFENTFLIPKSKFRWYVPQKVLSIRNFLTQEAPFFRCQMFDIVPGTISELGESEMFEYSKFVLYLLGAILDTYTVCGDTMTPSKNILRSKSYNPYLTLIILVIRNLIMRLKTALKVTQSDISNIRQVQYSLRAIKGSNFTVSTAESANAGLVLELIKMPLNAERKKIQKLIDRLHQADRIFASSVPRYNKEKEIIIRRIRKDQIRQDPITVPDTAEDTAVPHTARNATPESTDPGSPIVRTRRSNRIRKVPNRLNIFSTKGQIYQ